VKKLFHKYFCTFHVADAHRSSFPLGDSLLFLPSLLLLVKSQYSGLLLHVGGISLERAPPPAGLLAGVIARSRFLAKINTRLL